MCNRNVKRLQQLLMLHCQPTFEICQFVNILAMSSSFWIYLIQAANNRHICHCWNNITCCLRHIFAFLFLFFNKVKLLFPSPSKVWGWAERTLLNLHKDNFMVMEWLNDCWSLRDYSSQFLISLSVSLYQVRLCGDRGSDWEDHPGSLVWVTVNAS